MAQKPETKFRLKVVAPFLDQLQNTVRFPIQQLTITGDPDYLLCVRGKFVALELKAEGEEPRALQQYKLNQVEKAGGVALVANPENWPVIRLRLWRLDQGEE